MISICSGEAPLELANQGATIISVDERPHDVMRHSSSICQLCRLAEVPVARDPQ